MYTIYCIELDDPIVSHALDILMNDRQAVLPHTNGNFVLVTDNNAITYGNGNPTKDIAVLLGHGSPNGLSGQAVFSQFNAQLMGGHRLNQAPSSIWVLSCATSGEGSLFAYGNFAQSVKSAFPNSIVWASDTNVNSHTFEGDWRQVQGATVI